MFPSTWRPVRARDLVRIGSPGDGGYVVSAPSLRDVTLLLSMGLNDDWRFEEDFRARTGARIRCFDGSVDERFWLKHALRGIRRGNLAQVRRYWDYRRFFGQPGVEHVRKMIGFDRDYSVSLDTVLADVEDRNLFLKMDIEGGEYRILDQIVQHRSRFTGLAMELHDVDLHRDRIDRFLNAMQGFTIIALYPNNVGGVDRDGDPTIIEISMAQDRFVTPDPAAPLLEAVPNDPALPNLPVRYAQSPVAVTA